MNRRKFINVCTCYGLASSLGVLQYNNSRKNLTCCLDNKVIYSIDIHINEHCNLKCRYCYHFGCIAEEEYYDLDKFEQDIRQTSSIVHDKHVGSIVLLGGEPLLNPNINKYIEITRRYYTKTNVSIATNGLLLDSMNEEFWKTLNKYNVVLSPTIYPVKINWASILDKAKKYNVRIYGNEFVTKYSDVLTLDNIDKFKKTMFGKKTLKEDATDRSDIHRCYSINGCTMMHHGKLYICPTAAYIRHLNKKFNTNFIVSEGDYLDLYKAKDINDVKNFMKKPYIPFCKYCAAEIQIRNWENAQEHYLSEWT